MWMSYPDLYTFLTILQILPFILVTACIKTAQCNLIALPAIFSFLQTFFKFLHLYEKRKADREKVTSPHNA